MRYTNGTRTTALAIKAITGTAVTALAATLLAVGPMAHAEPAAPRAATSTQTTAAAALEGALEVAGRL